MSERRRTRSVSIAGLLLLAALPVAAQGAYPTDHLCAFDRF
jgi:hypothetical protein